MGDIYSIVDECQKVNGVNSKISGALTRMVKEQRINKIALLSGTLHSTGYHDLGNISVLLGIYENRFQFEHHHVNYHKTNNAMGQMIKIRTGYKNIDKLTEKIHSKGVLLTRDKANLPTRHKYEYTSKIPRNEEYDILKKHSVLDGYFADNPGVLFLGLRMLASNFIKKRDYLETYEPIKKKALHNILQNELLNDDRVLIFYERTQELQDIKSVCKDLKRPFSYINGQGQNRKNFYNKQNGVIAIQYQSGSEGINGLQIANKTVYYSPTLSGGLFEQSQKRTDRIGQKSNEVHYIYIKTEGTIEEEIYKNLVKYQNYTEDLFRG
ncbi:MAG: hypothetical protein ACK5MR_10230 [Cumulibacter sp.]